MLKNELLTEHDERYDELKAEYGTCRFCGQVRALFPIIGPWEQEKLDECASEICGCIQSDEYAHRKERFEIADALIIRKFGHSLPDCGYMQGDCNAVCELLSSIASAVINEKVGKTTVRINSHIKCDISVNSKTGKVKIDRTITHKDSAE